METLPIPRTTLAGMVEAYVLAEQEVRQAFGMLVQARERLKVAFIQPDGYRFRLNGDGSRHGGRPDYEKPEEILSDVKREVWACLVEKMELRRILSIKRAEELDKQIETGDGLPAITLENILAMLEGTINQAGAYIEESVKEVYEWLRPHTQDYKTNSIFEVDRKVIKWGVERKYSGGGFRINYHRQKEFTALDNVFHALDGKGCIAKSHYGPLYDAVYSSPDGKGETDYFRFKCYGNGNIHMEFKREDLLAKFNQVAGGMRLKNSQAEQAAA